MPLRHHARNGAGESAGFPNRRWSRSYRGILRAGAVRPGPTGNDAEQFHRLAARGEDCARASIFRALLVVALLRSARLCSWRKPRLVVHGGGLATSFGRGKVPGVIGA